MRVSSYAGRGGESMGRRARKADEFRVVGVVERLAPYDVALVGDVGCPEAVGRERVERTATLFQLMPRNQRRATIENLVASNDRGAVSSSGYARRRSVRRRRRHGSSEPGLHPRRRTSRDGLPGPRPILRVRWRRNVPQEPRLGARRNDAGPGGCMPRALRGSSRAPGS
jgi:hypothetical protein